MAEYQPDEIARLEKLFYSNPEGRVFTHLAEAYRKLGDLGRARQVLEDGLRRHDGYASAHVVLGRVLNGLGDADGAAREFRRVLELDPENRIALQSLAEQAERQGQPAAALEHLQRLAQLDPMDVEVQDTISRLQAEAAAAEREREAADRYEPGAEAPEHSQAGAAEADAPFEPLDHLLGADLGMPASAYGTDDDPFASLGDDWTGGYGDAAPADAAETPDAAAGDWPALDAGEAPALRFEWGLTPAEGASDAPVDEPAASPPEGQAAAEWLSSINADWDTPAGIGAAGTPDPESEAESQPPAGADGGEGEGPSEPAGAEAGGTSEPEAESGREPEADAPFDPIDGGGLLPDAADTEVYTETLAALYRAQGFTERAIAVYRSLLADRPGDERLMQKLREMEGAVDTTRPEPGDLRAAAQWAEVADDLARGDAHVERAADAGAPAEDAPADAADESDASDESDEQWLEGVESVWTGGGTTADPASPYSWTGGVAEEDGERGSGPTIGALLGGLLAWRPTRSAGGEPTEELLLIDEVSAADVEGETVEGGIKFDAPEIAAPQPDAGDAAGAADAGVAPATEHAGPDAAEPSSGAERDPWDELPGGGAFTESGASAGSGDAAEAASAGPDEAVDEPYVPMPWEEDEGDEPHAPEPAAPAADTQPAVDRAVEPAAEAGQPAGQDPDDGTDEDDDLELFRSWLQSLKK